jgi:phytoene dehydrogenase-like protein
MKFSKKDQITDDYDAIIIGGGLGGLTASNRLASMGHKVLLLESHNKLGGLATWFRRKQGQHIFDVSLHGFPFGMKKNFHKYWSKEIAACVHPLKSVRFKNPQFDIETDFTKENYMHHLIHTLGADPQKTVKFFEFLEGLNFYDAPKMTNRELFNEFFPGRNDIMRFLLEPMSYANGSTLEDPAITFAIVFMNFLSKGVFIFKGGTDTLINKLQEQMLENNVDIKLHSQVEKIEVQDGKVVGVRLGGKLISAKTVLSNTNIVTTIKKLVGENEFSQEYMKKTNEVRLNTSSCQVYMGLKPKESIPFMGDLFFYSEDEEFTTDKLLSPKVGSQTFSFYYPDTREHLDPRYSIVSSSNAKYEDWENLSDSEYKIRKEFLVERALDSLSNIVPGIESKIDYLEAATPKTLEKFTHHPRGTSFGTKFEGLEVSMELNEQIEGLYHAGSVGIIMSGWLGAANYGAIQSNKIHEYLDTLENTSLNNQDSQNEESSLRI